MSDKARLDKWLWAARFYKTRSLAAAEIAKGRVQVNDQPAKPAREVKLGDRIAVRREAVTLTVLVLGLSQVRGPASVAQQLYEETAESQAAREQLAEQRRLAAEPAHSLDTGRPTKRDRRELERWRRSH